MYYDHGIGVMVQVQSLVVFAAAMSLVARVGPLAAAAHQVGWRLMVMQAVSWVMPIGFMFPGVCGSDVVGSKGRTTCSSSSTSGGLAVYGFARCMFGDGPEFLSQ
jgi:hypothetical protein